MCNSCSRKTNQEAWYQEVGLIPMQTKNIVIWAMYLLLLNRQTESSNIPISCFLPSTGQNKLTMKQTIGKNN